jgi:hypothetical protein
MSHDFKSTTPVVVANHDGNLASVALRVLQKAGCSVDPISFLEAASRRFVHVDRRPVHWSPSQAIALMTKAGFQVRQIGGVLSVEISEYR